MGQFRFSLALVSLALLWIVVELVGDGSQPGVLDATLRNAGHGAGSANDASPADKRPQYQVAVTEAYSGTDDAGTTTDASQPVLAPASAHRANAWALDSSSDAAAPDAQPEDLPPPPDVGIIHK